MKRLMKTNKVWAALCGLVVLLGSCDKTEKTVPVTEVTLDETEITLKPGETKLLVASVAPEDADYDAIVWTSNNEEVATVSEDGTVTAVAKGEATVTAQVGDVHAECKVSVVVPVTGVTLNTIAVAIKTNGDPVQLTATVTPEDASENTVTWTSSEPSVATVSENGLVTPVAVGYTVITASVAGFTAECNVTVTVPAKTWTVGEYYDVDGVTGVVVWTSDDKEHGKIISMKETICNKWATGSYNTGANSEEDGKANTEKVKDINSDLSQFPAFKWCVELGTGWYLPAISEVYYFLNNSKAVNATLEAKGGDKLTDYYWSSTEALEESASTEALYGYFKSNGTAGGYSDYKDDPEGDMAVRAMHQF